MKKSLKILAAGLAIIPCALALTACGGTSHELVDTTGSYREASSYDAVQEYVDETQTTTELDQYRMMMNMTMSGGGVKLTLNTNSYIQFDGTTLNNYTSIDMAMSMKYIGKEEFNTETCIKDNYLYSSTDLGGWTSPVQLDFSELEGYMGATLSLDEVFASLGEIDKEGLNVKVEQTEDATKFKIELDGSVLEAFMSSAMPGDDEVAGITNVLDFSQATANIYYVFENNEFSGAALDINLKMTVSEGTASATISCRMTMEFAKFEGEIPFPTNLPSAN